jgi:DNA repair exonuclease SbcCD nuclease subunit
VPRGSTSKSGASTSDASFTFVHVADLHLDTPFHGVDATAPGVASALREASLEAFDAIVDLTIARSAAFLVVAGDVYDGPERGVRAQLRFRAGLERLATAGIAAFVVHGNHDPVDEGWSAIDRWPPGVVVFGSERVDVVPVERDGEVIASVQGISFSQTEERENLALRLRRDGAPGFTVGVLHCNVEGSPDTYARYSPCTLEDLLDTGLDYLALGHIHERTVLHGEPGRGPWVVYPGNSQARSPRATERGPKGATVVEVVDGAVDHLEFVPCDRVRFDEVTVPIDELEDLGAIEDELIRASKRSLDDADGRSIILRGRLVGRGPLHTDLARPGALSGLLDDLRHRTPTAAPFVWWDELADDSASAIDIEDVRGRGDFAADLVAVADDLFADEEALTTVLDKIAASAPRALQRDVEVLLGDRAWIAGNDTRATMLALDALLSEDG